MQINVVLYPEHIGIPFCQRSEAPVRWYVGFTVPEGKVHRIPQDILYPQLSSTSLAYLMGDYVPIEEVKGLTH